MGKRVSIGLDIGSSAVRAAEVTIDGGNKVLRRFAQVGLPEGAVVEGEVHDQAAVTEAVKRLWQHGGFSAKKVVVGLGSQRAMVRQVDMPPMSDDDLRSALKFKMGEFLPIPVEQAVVDFAPLPSAEGDQDHKRVLLVAAQRDVVVDQVAAVEAAGLRVTAVDSSSLALLRAVTQQSLGESGTGDRDGLEAVVGIGAELVTVVVRQDGVPRFIRTVALAGPGAPRSGPDSRGAPSLGTGVPGNGRGGVSVGVAPRLDAIVTEVRSSLEYLLSQTGTGRFQRVLITGGGAMLAGVTEALSSAVGLPVERATVQVELDRQELALDDSALDEAANRWLTAVGLALWGTDAYGTPSLLPNEVRIRRQQQTTLVAAVAGVAAVVVVLGAVSFGRLHTASNINNAIRSENAQSLALQGKINGLNYVLRVPAEVKAERAMAATALSGDINWLGALQHIAAAIPQNVTPTLVTLTKTEATTVSVTPTTTVAGATGPTIVGTLSITATTKGGAPAVAQFIDKLSRVKGVYELWVSSTSNAAGTTTLQGTAELTGSILSDRVALLPGGSK